MAGASAETLQHYPESRDEFVSSEPKYPFATRTEGMGCSAIREILKLTEQPDIISFAGGLPGRLLPEEERSWLRQQASEFGNRVGQYGPTEGMPELIEESKPFLRSLGVDIPSWVDIRVVSGSQETLFLTGMVFVNPGDGVAVEAPTYLGLLQAVNAFNPCYRSIPCDSQGMIAHELRKELRKGGIKLIYIDPTFQNPTGHTMSEERRDDFASVVDEFNGEMIRQGRYNDIVMVLEDDPYSKLRYDGVPVGAVHRRIPAYTIFTATLSKYQEPGRRIAFYVAPREVARKLVIAKQGVDLFTSTNNQAEAIEYLKHKHLDRHVQETIPIYRERRDVMITELERQFPSGWRFTHPDGGMFLWGEGPEGVNTKTMLVRAIERKVAFVPGESFFADGSGANTMRLNFSYSTPDMIREGVGRLVRVAEETTPTVLFQEH